MSLETSIEIENVHKTKPKKEDLSLENAHQITNKTKLASKNLAAKAPLKTIKTKKRILKAIANSAILFLIFLFL